MTIAVLLIIVAVVSLLVIVRVASKSSLTSRSLRSLQPLDVAAFRNLIDPEQDAYLRSRLPGIEYRRVQRLRLRAAATYVRVAVYNANVLVRIGQMSLASRDETMMEAAQQLVHEGLRLRRNASLAMVRIYVAQLWPTAGFGARPVLDDYGRLTGSASLLGRLQNPSGAVMRISES